MQALGATIISGLVIVIAFMQWRTAHQKVVLDLFERRLKVFETVEAGVDMFFSGPRPDTVKLARQTLYEAYSKSRFLFGDEVSQEIFDLSSAIFEVNYLMKAKDEDGIGFDTRNRLIDRIVTIDGELNNWRRPFTTLCNPYLRMDQKRVRTPAEWFRDRNEIRKSFGDPS